MIELNHFAIPSNGSSFFFQLFVPFKFLISPLVQHSTPVFYFLLVQTRLPVEMAELRAMPCIFVFLCLYIGYIRASRQGRRLGGMVVDVWQHLQRYGALGFVLDSWL